MEAQVEFFHDRRFKQPFNLFEALWVRDYEIDVENNKIKLPNFRKRKFHRVGSVSGRGKVEIFGQFEVNKVKYYFHYKKNINKLSHT